MPDRTDGECCFIMSAIGKVGDPAHDDADWVRTELIEPALARANEQLGTKLWAYRSDMRHRAENLWHAILQSILSDRLLFVVLDYKRPNISYELGIAQSAARPTIILKDKRLKHQFDVYHLKYVDYSRKDSADKTATTIVSLTKTIIETYRAGFPDFAFDGERISPLNGRKDLLHLYEKFKDISFDDWSRIIVGAKSSIDIVGKTLLDLALPTNNQFSIEALDGRKIPISLTLLIAAQALFGGVSVTIIMMHQDNPALEGMIDEVSPGMEAQSLLDVRRKLSDSLRLWTQFAADLDYYDDDRVPAGAFEQLRARFGPALPLEKRGKIKVVQLRRGQVKFRMTLTDNDVLATPIFYKIGRNGSGPAIRAHYTTNTYAALRQELEYLKSINSDPKPDLGMPKSDAAE